MKKLTTIIPILVLVVIWVLMIPQATTASKPYPNCRFGVGIIGVVRGLADYDVTSLNAGWYLNWRAEEKPSHPNGMEFVQTIRLLQTGSTYTPIPHKSQISTIVESNPGSIWFIGNEPDRLRIQDDIVPELYAQAYHDLYYFLKEEDPTCQVGIGAIVQPTPVRFEYLEKVLDTYLELYGEILPTDIWNIHSFILREEMGEWGAEIPPGISATQGALYQIKDCDNMEIFKERIVEFRQWMQDHGEQKKPLFISEYGIVMPYEIDPGGTCFVMDEDGQCFPHERVKAFMYSTFDYLLTAADEEVGNPYDDNRLVQRWVWYSINDPLYGGFLFDPLEKNILELGQDYGNYVAALTPFVDLQVVDIFSEAVPIGDPIPLKAVIANTGNVATEQDIEVLFYDADSGTLLGQATIPGLGGCAATATVGIEVQLGVSEVRVVVDPEANIDEGEYEDNNERAGAVL